MVVAKSMSVVTEQPRLHIEHRVLMAPAAAPGQNQSQRLEKLLDEFYGEHGSAWELVNVFKVGASDFIADHQEMMFIFQRRTYQAAPG